MSLTVPLAVRLKTALADRMVTRDVRDLQFRSSVPGGFASATIALDRPLHLQPEEIAYYASLYVYDTRSGEVMWEGRVEDPGRGAGADGQVWELAAVGPAAHARDRTVPLIYIDRSLNRWEPWEVTAASNGTGAISDNDPGLGAAASAIALTLTFPAGTDLVGNSRVVRQYRGLVASGQKLARYDFKWDAGTTHANLRVQALTRTNGGTSETDRDEAFNTAGSAGAAKVITTDFTAGRDLVEVRLLWNGAALTVTGDLNWLAIYDLYLQATRYNKSGTELTAGADYATSYVLASDIVADLLGRLLPAFDGAGASIATTTHQIDSLAYPDGVTPAKVLEDLMLIEPAYYWAAWESNSAGKHRYEWAAWPSTIRYEATVGDGFRSPGSAAELYDKVRVRYREINDAIRTVQRTQTVQELTDAGLTREAFIDLGDEASSLSLAQRAGDQFLAEHADPPNAGTLRISRPILDLTTGRTVMPWQIRPGGLIRVRGVLPRVDSLNATARDGVTVFRVVSSDFNAADAAAVLELDSYPLSTARALAQLQQRQPARRR